MDDKISNSIAKYQQIINELEKLKEKVTTSETKNIRFRIETKHWYGYGIERSLFGEKSILDISEETMQIILDEAVKIERKRIDKLIDMEIEQRNNKKEV